GPWRAPLKRALRPLIGHEVDLDLAIDHHAALDAGAGRRMRAEIAFVDAVEGPEIARIVEPDADAHHVFEPVAGLVENGQHVLHGLVGFLDNGAAHDLAVLHGHLPRDIEPATGLDGAGERQALAAG